MRVQTPITLTTKEQKAVFGGVLPRELARGEAALRLGGKLKSGTAQLFHRDGGK